MTVESNSVIAIATLSDWLKRLAPVFQPMRGKTKINRTMCAWSFPRFELYSAANDPETGNDPQIGPQMIPNRKWSPMWTANDPAGKQRMAWILVSWIFLKIFSLSFFFHQLKDKLDQIKEKIYWQRKL